MLLRLQNSYSCCLEVSTGDTPFFIFGVVFIHHAVFLGEGAFCKKDTWEAGTWLNKKELMGFAIASC